MAEASFRGVGKHYDGHLALDDFTLDVADGELVAVLGPSGCGKSTLLRVTAGLERASTGTIHVGGRRIDDVAPQDRDVAMVFQSYALYPHLTVRENVEFPLRMRGIARDVRRRRAEEVASRLEIDAVLDRRPVALSGGQRQRVALARALVREPALFLLDEPLSNLDARLRASVRAHIKALQRRVGVTTLYVTHDQTEAMSLGDRVVVLAGGRIQQVAPPEELYAEPATTFVASFVGTPGMNLLPARRMANGIEVVAAPKGDLVVGVRPEAFVTGAVDGMVVEIDPTTREFLGAETLVRGRIAGHEVQVRLASIVGGVLPARVVAPREAWHLFDANGRRI
ncbi:MAG TPA: ATP-binding cassette domain-containing protein [Candidatus Binatia bacterium]|jgi:ABC-type sugar transport system ATPase subunit|nr:ATP-binding cassette domain-containing protein [Candidatus Binatia bacterium]